MQAAVVADVVFQHLDDAISLRTTRSALVRSANATLDKLRQADERLAAHLDGLSIAGDAGARMAESALERADAGQVFVVTLLAVRRRDVAQIERLLSLVDVLPAAARGMASAFGWASAPLLKGLTAPLLVGKSPAARWLGIATCAMHRVDPGPIVGASMDHPDARLRARALQAAGELGRTDLLPHCLAHLADEDPLCGLAAARSGLLLGNREEALQALRTSASKTGPSQADALALALFGSDHEASRASVRQLAAQGLPPGLLIKAAGWAGDPQVVPWLLKHMQEDKTAQLAGEALGFITGIDLTHLNLTRQPPGSLTVRPSDDPADDQVALDEDDSLPWPDLSKVTAWWQQNSGNFVSGHRYFCGAPVNDVQFVRVLRQQAQRRRIAAAHYLCLLQPGLPLFNVAAPARRQQQVLGNMEPA